MVDREREQDPARATSEAQDEDAVIASIARRARSPATRTDLSDVECPPLAPPLTAEELRRAEAATGFPLHPFHRRLLMEVGNGGFGPGDGLIGLPGGRLDDSGRTAVELTRALDDLPPPLLVLWEWGDAFWACLDGATGHVLTLYDAGIVDTGRALREVMGRWAAGVRLWDELFTASPVTDDDRPERAPWVRTIRPVGVPYAPPRRKV